MLDYILLNLSAVFFLWFTFLLVKIHSTRNIPLNKKLIKSALLLLFLGLLNHILILSLYSTFSDTSIFELNDDKFRIFLVSDIILGFSFGYFHIANKSNTHKKKSKS